MLKRVTIAFILTFALVVTIAPAQAEITVTLVEPMDGLVTGACQDLLLKADVATTAGETIQEVRFFYNGKQKYRDRSEPWEYVWKSIYSGVYDIQAKATDSNGVEAWSDVVHVKIGSISNGERIFNGEFSCGTIALWTLYNHEDGISTVTVMDDNLFDDQYYLMFNIEQASTDWYVQFGQTMPIDSGHVYEIYFYGDADYTRDIIVGMQEGQDPYATELWETVSIDGPDLYGPFEVVATKNDPTNIFKFVLGQSTIPFYLDNVQVIDRSLSSVLMKELSFDQAPREYELMNAYPNPFNMSTNIRYRLSHEATVQLDIFDMQGRKVNTIASGMFDAGRHTAQWNGLMFDGQIAPSGVYIFRLTGEAQNAKRFNLSRKILLLK